MKKIVIALIVIISIVSIAVLVADYSEIVNFGIFKNDPPTLSVYASPNKGYQPCDVDFYITANDIDGNIASYYIDFGDGTYSTEKNPSHTYYAGDYTAVITVIDNHGAKTTEEVNIKIQKNVKIDSYAPTDDNGYAVMEVNVIGDSDVEIVLNKDNRELDSIDIKQRQFDDGNEYVYLKMCSTQYETPLGGEYKILIYDKEGIITSETINYEDPSLEITYFYPSFETYYYLDERIIDEISIRYKNNGDLPAYVSEIYISGVMDSEYKSVEENSRYIEPGGTKMLSGATYIKSTYYVDDIISVKLLDEVGNVISNTYYYNK
ncbi:MAG: PKD domain-containing protein [Candidatus Thermoplasmatota archaeon]|nr:PKD domain-containing protein [Candidatus Thermoplasmatota archaeon]